MKNNKLTNPSVICLTFAGLLILAAGVHANDLAPAVPGLENQASAPNRSLTQEIGETGVVIARSPGGSVSIARDRNISDAIHNASFFYSNSCLLKVGDVYTREKNIAQLNTLLRGPVGSTVDVTLLEGHRQVVRTLTRYSRGELHATPRCVDLLSHLQDLFTGWFGSDDSYEMIAKDCQLSGNNLVAAPFVIAEIDTPKFLQPAEYDDATRFLPDALDYFSRVGMYGRFDSSVKKCLKLSSDSGADISDAQSLVLARCADALARNDKLAEAKLIYGRLLQSLPHQAEQTKLIVNSGRSALLERTADDATAFKSYLIVFATCEKDDSLPRDLRLSKLQQVVAYASKSRHYELAYSAQSKIVELEGNSTNASVVPMYKKLVEALIKLSEIYVQTGNLDKAQAALTQAIGTSEEKVTADELVVLERTCSPCLSELKIRLASIYIRRKEYAKALSELGGAEKLLSDALGSDSSKKEKLQKLSAALQADASDSTVANALKELSAIIQTDPEDMLGARTRDSLLAHEARSAYDAAFVNKNKACEAIQSLINKEKAKSTHSPDDITRLINLVCAVELPPYAIDMLRSLDFIDTDPDKSLSSSRIFRQAELCMLVAMNGKTSNSSKSVRDEWTKLEELVEAGHEIPNGRRGRDEIVSQLHRLILLSYSYAFRDEPAKALQIAEHAWRRYLQVEGRDAAFLYYLAILYLLQDDMADAQKQIELAKTASNKYWGDSLQMKLPLSRTLFNTGHPQEGLKLLDHVDGMNRNANSKLAYQRACLEYKLGDFKEALVDISAAGDDVMLPGQGIIGFRLLKGRLLAKTGQSNQAILAFCSVAGNDRAQEIALEAAVEEAKKMDSVPIDTLERLAKTAENLRGPQLENGGRGARSAHQDALLSVVDGLLKNQSSNSSTREPEFNYYREYARAQQGDKAGYPSRLASIAQYLENNKKGNASAEWSRVARAYFDLKRYDEGTASLLHALKISTGDALGNGMYHYGNLRGDLGFAILLNAKRYSDAEHILKASIATHKPGTLTAAAFLEKAMLCELFMQQDKFEQAKKCAEEIVSTIGPGFCAGKLEAGPAHVNCAIDVINGFTAKGQYKTAQNLLDRVIATQTALVGPRHPLFVETFQAYAKLLSAESKLPDAEDYARKALDLENWIGGSANMGRTSATLLASILRKEGKNDEADKVSVTRPVPENRHLNGDDWKTLYNLNFSGFHMRTPELYALTAGERLKQMLADAIAAHGEGSRDVTVPMDNLTKFYVQQHRFEEAEKVQLRKLEIADSKFGKCIEPKVPCYLTLAETYLLAGDLDNACKYASLITEPPKIGTGFDQPDVDLRVANLLFATGRKADALEIARKAETKLTGKYGHAGISDFDKSLDNCLKFMEISGAVEDSNALRAFINARKEALSKPGARSDVFE